MDCNLRDRFDRLLEEVLLELPANLRNLLEEVPLVVEDRPSRQVMERLGVDDPLCLCGLYTGIPLTHRSVQHSGTLPEVVNIFRQGVIEAAAARSGRIANARLKRQIRITLLHEMGHHFGLKEKDLRKLGYQ